MNKYTNALKKAKDVFFNPNEAFKYKVNDINIVCIHCKNDYFIREVNNSLQSFEMELLVCTKCSFIMPFGASPIKVEDNK